MHSEYVLVSYPRPCNLAFTLRLWRWQNWSNFSALYVLYNCHISVTSLTEVYKDHIDTHFTRLRCYARNIDAEVPPRISVITAELHLTSDQSADSNSQRVIRYIIPDHENGRIGCLYRGRHRADMLRKYSALVKAIKALTEKLRDDNSSSEEDGRSNREKSQRGLGLCTRPLQFQNSGVARRVGDHWLLTSIITDFCSFSAWYDIKKKSEKIWTVCPVARFIDSIAVCTTTTPESTHSHHKWIVLLCTFSVPWAFSHVHTSCQHDQRARAQPTAHFFHKQFNARLVSKLSEEQASFITNTFTWTKPTLVDCTLQPWGFPSHVSHSSGANHTITHTLCSRLPEDIVPQVFFQSHHSYICAKQSTTQWRGWNHALHLTRSIRS